MQVLNELCFMINFLLYWCLNVTSIFNTDVVDDMKRRGIEFYTIGTGDSPNVGELGDIATDPDSEHDFRSV